ncbi:MAG: L-aspartate oxidase [Nitrospirae bacterium]|nr:L-aspartate oxidase [Nitrospirota bacterium]
MKSGVLSTDYLVIGSGVAGLRAAIELAMAGSVLVITKDKVSESSTEYAQGGVAVALSDEDEIRFHLQDTLEAGDGLCDEENVGILVSEGPERIKELISWGAEFDKEGSRLAFTREAAHSQNRILHAKGDSTGKEIERALLAKVKATGGITKYDFSSTVDLIVKGGAVVGALVLKEREKKLVAVYAKAVVLATGGLGQVYQRTTNPTVATGDGMAIAYRAGATMVDMEFVQFHPTSLFVPSAPQFLLSEAIRGEGAHLVNVAGERFMPGYHTMAELAPRDVVSRSIVSEMAKTDSDHVYLDLSGMGAEFVKKRFPRIYATCLTYDIDITEERVPVCPAAHYMMGGVRTDKDGATDLPGLFAAGEVACTGVHGANRLASNSLLEGIVFGARAGAAAAEFGRGVSLGPGLLKPVTCKGREIKQLDLVKLRSSLRRLMWSKAGIIRCGRQLSEALTKLDSWAYLEDGTFMSRRELEIRNMAVVGTLIARAASERKGSVGAHYRSDAKDRGVDWRKRFTFKRG